MVIVDEHLRRELAALALPHAASSAGNTVSVNLGVATTVPGRNCARHDLVAFADSRLYEAKNTGRNRHCSGILDFAATL